MWFAMKVWQTAPCLWWLQKWFHEQLNLKGWKIQQSKLTEHKHQCHWMWNGRHHILLSRAAFFAILMKFVLSFTMFSINFFFSILIRQTKTSLLAFIFLTFFQMHLCHHYQQFFFLCNCWLWNIKEEHQTSLLQMCSCAYWEVHFSIHTFKSKDMALFIHFKRALNRLLAVLTWHFGTHMITTHHSR